jgi:hypothetical protein
MEYLRRMAEQDRAQGHYATFWQLRREFLPQQAASYAGKRCSDEGH